MIAGYGFWYVCADGGLSLYKNRHGQYRVRRQNDGKLFEVPYSKAKVIIERAFNTTRIRNHSCIPVEHVDENGKVLHKFESICEAAQFAGVTKQHFGRALRYNGHCKGMKFRKAATE